MSWPDPDTPGGPTTPAPGLGTGTVGDVPGPDASAVTRTRATQPASAASTPSDPDETTPPALPALQLREPLPALTRTQSQLEAAVAALAAGRGPVAVDTERASGYRYGQRAYLVQLRREGAGTFLVDPIAAPDLEPLAQVLSGPEWVLHAASQDLPCLAEIGLVPQEVFDTELAARLLGWERVGLAAVVERVLGHTLAKVHGAADWSTRPLPREWLEYAALDVEVLVELRDALSGELDRTGKAQFARQEFEAVRTAPPAAPREDPWRRTSGLHRVRTRRGLAVVEQVWGTRDRLAQEADVAPGRLLPDSAVIALATTLPREGTSLTEIPGFHGRGAGRHHREWSAALRRAWQLTESDLPTAARRGDGPPPPRAWAQRDPAAAARLDRARAALADRAATLSMPVENLLTPELVRRVMWQPPADGDVAGQLLAAGARPWQVQQCADLLVEAITPTAAAG